MDLNTTTIKLTTAWGAVYIAFSWAELAAMFATFYTILLIGEWIWKHGGQTVFSMLAKKVRSAATAYRLKRARVIKRKDHT